MGEIVTLDRSDSSAQTWKMSKSLQGQILLGKMLLQKRVNYNIRQMLSKHFIL